MSERWRENEILYWAILSLLEKSGGRLVIDLPHYAMMQPGKVRLNLSVAEYDGLTVRGRLQITADGEQSELAAAFAAESKRACARLRALEDAASTAGIGHLERMEARILNRIKTTAEGRCLSCNGQVRDWKPVTGSFAPEWWQTQRENGIDPATGHKLNCQDKGGSDE